MIARHETHLDKIDIWSALAAPLPPGTIAWRQDGRPVTRDGRHSARFVAYVEANTVRERLDAVVPGEWDITLELLPMVTGLDEDANQGACSFKCRLQILGVVREDVGTGKDYKQAATDAFKRSAVRFGIAHELYAYEQNWVQMDGDGKYAKPVEDPAVAYARRYGGGVARPLGATPERPVRPVETTGYTAGAGSVGSAPAPERGAAASGTDDVAAAKTTDEQSCPKCGSRMWDNRLTKRNPKAPDYKCRDRSCDGVIWPPKASKATDIAPAKQSDEHAPDDESGADEEEEELPF